MLYMGHLGMSQRQSNFHGFLVGLLAKDPWIFFTGSPGPRYLYVILNLHQLMNFDTTFARTQHIVDEGNGKE